MNSPYTLRIPYTLELGTKIGTHTWAFVSEFDAELVVDYEDLDNWEITGLRFEQSRWNPEFEVTPKSDPDLWKLIDRSLDLDDKAVAEKVRQQIIDDRMCAESDRGDQMYEAYRERMWEAGR